MILLLTAPFLVGMTSLSPAIADVHADDVSCRPASAVPTASTLQTFTCAATRSGRYYVSNLKGPGSLSLCSIQAFGGYIGKLKHFDSFGRWYTFILR